MARKGRYLGLFLILALAASSMLTVKPVVAQTAPSTPQFTVKIGTSMVGGSVEIQIQNQPVIPNGHDTAWIFFDFRYKWHESSSWYHPEPGPTVWKRQYTSEMNTTGATNLVQSPNTYYDKLGNVGSQQLDIQVRAINGYQNTTVPFGIPIGIEPGDNPIIVVSASDWSSTQTITLPDYHIENPTATPSANPTATSASDGTGQNPTITQSATSAPSNDFMLIVTVALTVISVLLIAIVVFLAVLYKRIPKAQPPKQ